SRGGGSGPWTARPDPAAVVFLGAVILAAIAATLDRYAAAFFIAVAGLVAVGALAGTRLKGDGIVLALGVPYIVAPVAAAAWIADAPDHGVRALFWVLATVWATDIGAFFAGRLIGGPRLAPSVSPAKTWSGLFGGLIAAASVAAGAGIAGLIPLSAGIVGLGVGVSLVAQFGDLIESKFKRHFEVKDSGTLIPGHGGVLDRLDSLLTALPFFAAVELSIGNGASLWR
ncbi:MAG: phosphatidate cytidylyltransferase, partial [Alphaproteobacteria bacterium]|nr:phosphatidate cytidylyltransferase [Alphaproteobacteria bacterium]